MIITKTVEGGKALVSLDGRLDTLTSPEALEELISVFNEAKDVTLDINKLIYVSSAGLRVILALQKKAAAESGSLTFTGVSEEIMEIFEMTGFKNKLSFGG